MTKEFKLIRKEYCHKRGIKDGKDLTFIHQRVNRITGNQVFLATHTGKTPYLYEHARVDVSPYSKQKSLSIPKDMQHNRDAILNKTNMASWINKHVNLDLLAEDIGFLVLDTNRLTVVIGPNSMRFQNSFSIYFL